jgi:hypothetical protein
MMGGRKMSAADCFRFANLFVLPGWALLLFLPRWRWTRIVASRIVPVTLSAAYSLILATHWGESNGGGFGTLAAVRQLFASDWLLLGGWIHYLAFDLLAGCWQSDDSLKRRIPLVLVAPCLCLTFLFGPVGWMSYLLLRRWSGGAESAYNS